MPTIVGKGPLREAKLSAVVIPASANLPPEGDPNREAAVQAYLDDGGEHTDLGVIAEYHRNPVKHFVAQQRLRLRGRT